jgi:hypothetical protein
MDYSTAEDVYEMVGLRTRLGECVANRIQVEYED